MANSGFPVVVSAPSGAGKTSLCREVVRKDSGLVYSFSVTSRPRLASEREGEDYFFVSSEEFEERIRRGDFIEWTQIRRRYYGTPRKPLEQALNEGRTVLLDLDVHGARKIKGIFPDSVTVYILAPSLKDLEKRLRGRARDSEEEIQARLERASDEMRNIEEYDYVFVNESFEESVDRLRCIIEAERCRVKRRSKVSS
ncbi:MAG: guanylate kinase [bacterium]